MRRILDKINDVDFYIDDIIVHSTTWQRHLNAIRETLRRLGNEGYTIRPTKCIMAARSVEFLGHTIGGGVKCLHANNVKKIAEAEPPRNKKQVRSFLGLTAYYREFVKSYAEIAAPLSDLTKKGEPTKIRWEERHQKAFQTLKDALTTQPIL